MLVIHVASNSIKSSHSIVSSTTIPWWVYLCGWSWSIVESSDDGIKGDPENRIGQESRVLSLSPCHNQAEIDSFQNNQSASPLRCFCAL
ncbi:hypothetical protein MRB53_033327 [Persea americana]|uniref:Uncharacterized protein n=1 Tax=Persea americana TaxID=3435 RepID=A0ACC2KVE7_PERAE|nr:hypothetical protein MRB53_033327 [Persea americana]